MSSAGDLQIEKDLVRWPRARWVAVVLAVIVFQGVLLFLAPRALQGVRTRYPHEPTVSFVQFSAPSEWLGLQDTSLFTSANPRGFSGPAWIVETPRTYVPPDSLSPPSFLTFSELSSEEEDAEPTFAALPHTRSLPEPTSVMASIGSSASEPRSRLEIEDLAGRRVVSAPPIPIQYATDALRPTVMKALVDSDGSVFSCRIIENSGSKIADNSAIDLTRKLRFSPAESVRQRDSLSTIKVIFNWYALDASTTNGAAIRASPR